MPKFGSLPFAKRQLQFESRPLGQLQYLQPGDHYDVSSLANMQNELVRHLEDLYEKYAVLVSENINLRYDMEIASGLEPTVTPVGRTASNGNHPS